jgi:NAD(P)-dependent dehydrogenase (short-subunit alcohol dehydrogenase family)
MGFSPERRETTLRAPITRDPYENYGLGVEHADAELRANIPALAQAETKVAVITGGASGIGLATAVRCAQLGLKIMLVDRQSEALQQAAQSVIAQASQGAAAVRSMSIDVGNFAAVQALADSVRSWGPVALLMNNAGVGANPGKPWENLEQWRALLEVNLWGVIHGVQAFAPEMIARRQPALIINTGSKQGITLPPGNSAYNLSKAGVKAYTEILAHELRRTEGCAVSAHLLIPGFTFTGMTARGREKPPGAWTAAQVVDFMFPALARGEFYVLCPDNEVTRDIDARRVQWAADDLIKNRPALSRWHPHYTAEFARFME